VISLVLQALGRGPIRPHAPPACRG
jgi:hypothetical protein